MKGLIFTPRVIEVTAWVFILGTVGRLDLDTVSLRDGLIICGLLLAVAASARFIRHRLGGGRGGL